MLTDVEERDQDGYTSLMQVARAGNIKMVAYLCAKGANVNAQNKKTQETALTLACRGNFKETAEFLIYSRADIEMGAETPLIEAARIGILDLVQFLLKLKANVHAQTQTRDTALTHACNNGHTDVAELLLNYGAEIEHESEGYLTSLMKSCKNGHFFTAQLLILRGANFRMVNSTNETCLSLARNRKHELIIKLLLAQYAQSAYFPFNSPIDFSLTSSPIAVFQSPITASSDVSQNTAISDRPKAKPMSKKEGKNIQKACMKKMRLFQQKQQHRLVYRIKQAEQFQQQNQQLQQQNRQLQQKLQQLQCQLDEVQIQQMQQQQQHLHTSISTQNLNLHFKDFQGNKYVPEYGQPTLVTEVTKIVDSAPHHSRSYAEPTIFTNQVTTQTQPPSTTISSNEEYDISQLTLEQLIEQIPQSSKFI